jgi:hypothetical protein
MVCERMTFGKHEGEQVSDVPTSYLRWCLRICDNLEPWLRSAIAREMDRRNQEKARQEQPQQARRDLPANLTELIPRWYRQLALRYHPDRGGSVEAMRVVNDAHERLRELLQAGVQ